MSNLEELVHALPPELFNEGLRLTFTESASSRYVKHDYKPPSSLQVCRHLRSRYAESYYGNRSIFYVKSTIAMQWICVLTRTHVRLMKDIRLSAETFLVPDNVQADGPAELTAYLESRWCY